MEVTFLRASKKNPKVFHGEVTKSDQEGLPVGYFSKNWLLSRYELVYSPSDALTPRVLVESGEGFKALWDLAEAVEDLGRRANRAQMLDAIIRQATDARRIVDEESATAKQSSDLPEKWALFCDGNQSLVNEFLESMGAESRWKYRRYLHFPFLAGAGAIYVNVMPGYTPITDDQFRRLVLKQS